MLGSDPLEIINETQMFLFAHLYDHKGSIHPDLQLEAGYNSLFTGDSENMMCEPCLTTLPISVLWWFLVLVSKIRRAAFSQKS